MKTDQYSNIDLLIVDDEHDFRHQAVSYFKRIGFKVDQAEDGEEALNISTNRKFDVVILDIHMPGISGITVLEQLIKREPSLKVIMLTGGGTIEHAVESMKKGAYDFVTKPAKLEELQRLVVRASKAYELEKENRQLKAVIRRSAPDHHIVGQSEQMQEVVRLIQRTASSDKPVLIQGESGTGKELVARAIHRASPLADKPLIVVNCAALAEQLLESELFGHVKGAFTGADRDKAGALEIAKGGTILLDEVDNLSPTLQRALLRALQERTFRRLGETKERSFSCRIVGTAKSNISERVEDGEFLKDLYYRLNVLNIKVPPLRERNDDIEPIVSDFCLSWNENHGQDRRFHADALEKLKSNEWSGNVRELLNYLERILVDVEAPIIEALHIDRYEEIRREVNDKVFYLMHDKKLDSAKADFERLYIEEMLRRSQSQREAADRCGYSPQRLSHRIKELNILSPFAKASESMG